MLYYQKINKLKFKHPYCKIKLLTVLTKSQKLNKTKT